MHVRNLLEFVTHGDYYKGHILVSSESGRGESRSGMERSMGQVESLAVYQIWWFLDRSLHGMSRLPFWKIALTRI